VYLQPLYIILLYEYLIQNNLMHKHTPFAVMAAVLLLAIITLTLHTFNRANAQGNENVPSATGVEEHNVPGATGVEEHNATNAVGGEEHNVPGATGVEEHNATNAVGGEEHNATNATAGVEYVTNATGEYRTEVGPPP
jgi:hypothetical protein